METKPARTESVQGPTRPEFADVAGGADRGVVDPAAVPRERAFDCAAGRARRAVQHGHALVSNDALKRAGEAARATLPNGWGFPPGTRGKVSAVTGSGDEPVAAVRA